MSYQTWGSEGIDDKSREQMDNAIALPCAVGGALMADAHLGYGLPIGGVLALDNAVCPYAVGVDIACRMKISIFPIDEQFLVSDKQNFIDALNRRTFFGIGVENNQRYDHPVMDSDLWRQNTVLSENYEKGTRQLGTSGSGNHFVEFGVVTIGEDRVHRVGEEGNPLQKTPGPGQYVALMSHSGSRGTGAAVCNRYSKIAKELHPEFGDLGWLDLDTDAGREYWDAMSLMGDYAAANHNCIHTAIAQFLATDPLVQIENHHNFAWKETHNDKDVIVHRKGATPAGRGVLGVIPGSMGTPAFIVRGLGNAGSLNSASHGAGRVMSRTQARKTFNYKAEVARLAERGITVLSAGADEVCGVYKDIDQVMAAQTDLVETLAKFDPKIVKMCQSGKAED